MKPIQGDGQGQQRRQIRSLFGLEGEPVPVGSQLASY